jgi:hypothetical protein
MSKEAKLMSNGTKRRLWAVAQRLKGRELFPEAIARAKELFEGLK